MAALPELDALTPAQRAQLGKMATAMAGKPTIVRECVTPEMRKEWASYARDRAERGCTQTITEESAKRVVMAVSCEGGASTGTLEFDTQGPKHVIGRISMVHRQDGAESHMKIHMDSRWLGADCGSTPPGPPKPVLPPR